MEIVFSYLIHRVNFYHPRYKSLAHMSIIFSFSISKEDEDLTALGSRLMPAPLLRSNEAGSAMG